MLYHIILYSKYRAVKKSWLRTDRVKANGAFYPVVLEMSREVQRSDMLEPLSLAGSHLEHVLRL